MPPKMTETQKFEAAIERNMKVAATLWWNLSGMSLLSATLNNMAYHQQRSRAYRDFKKK